MDITKSLYILAANLCMVSFACADQISLNNGDTLKGTFVSESQTHVQWQLDSFGGLNIPLTAVASISVSDAITTAPPMAITPDKKSLTGNIELSGLYLSGNQDRQNFELDVGFKWLDGNSIHTTSLNYAALGQDNEPSEYDYDINYGVDWSVSDHLYWGNNISLSADDKRQIDRSVSIGTNLGHQFWQNDKGALSTEVGLTWISDKLFNVTTDDRLAWTWSGGYQRLLFDKVALSYSHQLNVSTEDAQNTQLSADLGVKIPVTEKIDTTISWDWSYDNQLKEGIEPIDRKVNFGINYEW